MSENNGDSTIIYEDMEPADADMKERTEEPVEEASIDISDQSNFEHAITDEESAYIVADKTTDSVNKEVGRNNSDIPEQMFENSSSSEGIDSAEAQLKKKAATVIVGHNHKFTVQSRYLRASPGSCHDFCKYGHRHEPEKKTKRPLMGKIREARPLMRTASGENIRNPVPDKETKNKPMLRRLSLPSVISAKDPPTLCEDKHSSKIVSPTRSKMKQVQSEVRPSSVVSPRKAISRIKIDIRDVTKTDARSTNSEEKLRQKRKEIKTKEEAGSYRNGEKEKAKGPVINSPRAALKKSPSIKALLVKNLKSFSRSRHQNNSEETKFNRSSDVPEITVNVVERNDTKAPEKASKSSLSREKAPKIPRGSRVAKVKGGEGNLKGSRLGLSSSGARETSHLEGVTPNKSGSTKQNGRIREDSGSKTTTRRAKDTVNLTVKSKRTGISSLEEKDGSAWKVKFRRGTVLNLQVGSNSPKKLHFKRGRILGEYQSSKAEAGQSLKSKDDITDESPDDKPEAEKVQLRRQEAAARKDNVDLNNVIEETASKLVKTRKSKVKALVGAFETVMSFRDRKPLVETSAS